MSDVRVSSVQFATASPLVQVGWAQFVPLATTADVRVSWAQFDPLAVATDVRVSWAEFAPRGAASSVCISWAQFDPLATTPYVQQAVQAGGAHRSQVKFTPLQNAECIVETAAAEFTCGAVAPHASARASFVTVGVSTTSGELKHVRANATAAVTGVGLLASAGLVVPDASACADFGGSAAHWAAGRVAPNGSAVAEMVGVDMGCAAGEVDPWGVRNPTDEELVMLVLAATRRNSLTSARRAGI